MSMLLAPLMRYITGGLLFLTLILGIALWAERRHGDKLERRNSELVELRQADRARYEAAQERARIDNETHVQQDKAIRDEITRNLRSGYERDLERLREQAKANRGSSGGPSVSGVPKASGGADADGVPDAPCDNLCASEIELRLMYLQNWVREQFDARRDSR